MDQLGLLDEAERGGDLAAGLAGDLARLGARIVGQAARHFPAVRPHAGHHVPAREFALYLQHSVMSRALRTEFDDRPEPVVEVMSGVDAAPDVGLDISLPPA